MKTCQQPATFYGKFFLRHFTQRILQCFGLGNRNVYVCVYKYIYILYMYIYIYVGTPAFQMGVTGHSTVNPLATTIHEFATPHVFFFAHIILRHPTIGEQ